MNKSLSALIGGTLLGSLLALSNPTLAAAPDGEEGYSISHRMDHMAERLDLSDQQRQDIEEVMQAGADQLATDRARMDELRAAMHELVADFDAGEAQQIADEMGEITARMSYQRVENRAAVYQLLDENQQAELESMQEQKQERSGKRHSRKR